MVTGQICLITRMNGDKVVYIKECEIGFIEIDNHVHRMLGSDAMVIYSIERHRQFKVYSGTLDDQMWHIARKYGMPTLWRYIKDTRPYVTGYSYFR